MITTHYIVGTYSDTACIALSVIFVLVLDACVLYLITMQNFVDAVKKFNVDEDLVKLAWNYEDMIIGDEISYSLPRRVTEDGLTNDVVGEIKAAETAFKEKVNAAREKYVKNIQYVRQMDSTLPPVAVTVNLAKSESKVPSCPVCNKPETRMKRHLETVHDMKENLLEFSIKCSRIIFENNVNGATGSTPKNLPTVSNMKYRLVYMY